MEARPVAEWSEARRRLVRAGLATLAGPTAYVGIWATLAPRSFYDDFPIDNRMWVSTLGPYNEHLVRDVGAFELGLLVVAVYAAVTLERHAVQAALLALLVSSVPHLLYHVGNTAGLSTGDNVVSLLGISLGVVIPLGLLPLTRRRGAAALD
jgi:hypothetical protein